MIPPVSLPFGQVVFFTIGCQLDWIFRSLTFIVGVEDNPANVEKVLASRFLLSLYTLDTFGWLVAKLMQYEVLRLAEAELGTSGVILVSLGMTTLEVIVEFVASSQTPRLFLYFSADKQLRARQLALFAMNAYGVSAAAGIVLYGLLGVGHAFDWLSTRAVMLLLTVAYNVQYSFLNQCGDQALELSKPHWLKTFEGVWLLFPSFLLCAAFTTRRKATAKSLSIFLSLARLMLVSVFVLVFLMLRENAVLRFSFAVFMSLMSASLCYNIHTALQRTDGEIVCRSIVNEEVEDQNTTIYPYLSELPSLDITLVAFYVCCFSLPDQAFNAIVSLVILRLSTEVSAGVAFVGIVAVVVYFLYQLRGKSRSSDDDSFTETASAPPPPPQTSEFTSWLQLLANNAISLTIAALLFIFVPNNVALYSVLPVLLVFTVSKQALHARFTAFIFNFPEERSSAVGYYANVLYVASSGPLLALNWVLVETLNSSRWQIAVVVLVASSAYALSSLFFGMNKRLRCGVDMFTSHRVLEVPFERGSSEL